MYFLLQIPSANRTGNVTYNKMTLRELEEVSVVIPYSSLP